MITLYRRPNDAWADEVQTALDEMVIAYETETVTVDAALPDDVPDTPALRDDGEVITGEAALRTHLEELEKLMNDWDRFQSDACYIEDDGTVC
jgi:glutathione S-transferase